MQVKKILQHYNLHPSKRLGQNFLIDKSVLKKIIEAANLKPTDVVLEVGPGLGVLTLELTKHVKKIIAIEKDKRMVEIVKNVLADRNVKIIHGDILKLDIDSLKIDWPLKIGHWKLVANIPYYLTSPLIRNFLESDKPPELLVLMIQKEVAQRICAKPPKMTLLSVAVQFYAEPKIISYVSKKSFWPQPKVDSAIIKIIPRATPTYGQHTDEFFKIVKISFSQPRKQIINNLSKGLNLNREKTKEILKKVGIKPTQRPGELAVDKWVDLAWIMRGK